ncbi:aldehyde dehydrogenase, partial [Candidatus Uhrbacteria bacterium]|nr:aldehyde dehydrogenase [Candidatus Uhrbacteria bacterium]
MVRVAINGFGRIGRTTFKTIIEGGFDKRLQVVAVNDLTDVKVLAHLLKYDSVYGRFQGTIATEEGGKITLEETQATPKKHLEGPKGTPDYLIVNGKKILVVSEKEPEKLPWGKLKIDIVLECSGRFTNGRAAEAHLKAGAKAVIVSAPVKQDGSGWVPTILKGVNESEYKSDKIISNASCTTNCVSPVTQVMEAAFGIKKAALTTIHSVTAEQNLIDGVPPGLHPDLTRARSALANIVPTTTGAAISTTEVITGLKNKFDGLAIRVPTIVGSLSDFTFLMKRKVTAEEINQAFKKASRTTHKGIIEASEEPLVSTDIIKNPHSAIVDLSMTKVIDGDMVKVLAWYDNE